MARAQLRDDRREMARDIIGLGQILQDESIIRDQSPLISAYGQCMGSLNSTSWEYNVAELEMIVTPEYINEYRNTIPRQIAKIIIHLTVDIAGHFVERTSVDDPIVSLEVDCKILVRGDQLTHQTAWHLDRITGSVVEECTNFVHPTYHFQYGGKNMPDNVGSILILEPPRIAHPPLDIILAVDFVISNYYPVTWRELRHDSERYRRILKRAQHRYWRPYALALGSNWEPDNASWLAPNYWPQLVGQNTISLGGH